MRLPRPRLTIRLTMLLVAVAALALAVEATRRRMAERSLAYRARAREHQDKAVVASLNALVSDDYRHHGRTPDPKYSGWKVRFQQIAEFHRIMEKKYELAATRPWLPVAADPDPPTEPR
jgi:hypothetical protein